MNAQEVIEISKSGYGGVNKRGQIVDRRIDPLAVPMQANETFGVPAPLSLCIHDLKFHATCQGENVFTKSGVEGKPSENFIVYDNWSEVAPSTTGFYWFTINLISLTVVEVFDGPEGLYCYLVGHHKPISKMKGLWIKVDAPPLPNVPSELPRKAGTPRALAREVTACRG